MLPVNRLLVLPLAALSVALLFSGRALAQINSGRSHIMLPPSYGATALSTIINAQANYVAASGDFLESAANARFTNALAANQEMDNSVKWVQTYFDRKAINREATRRPNFSERQQTLNEEIKKRIQTSYHAELKGDVVENLNWLLRELNAFAPAQTFVPGGGGTLVDTDSDVNLSLDDLRVIRLTDGGLYNGQKLVFEADSTEGLKIRWPRVLRTQEFNVARSTFELSRDEAVKELKVNGSIEHQTGERLKADLDALSEAFTAAYPIKRRTESLATYSSYTAGKKYLQHLALGIFRLIEVEDQRAFNGSYQFQGDSLAELVGHMHRYGLEFAPHAPGGEGVYRKLFFGLRSLHTQVAIAP